MEGFVEKNKKFACLFVSGQKNILPKNIRKLDFYTGRRLSEGPLLPSEAKGQKSIRIKPGRSSFLHGTALE